MRNIAILASGSGTNAENLIRYFKNTDDISVNLVATNVPDAGVIARAEQAGVPVIRFSRHDLESGTLCDELQKKQTDVVVLAGFLWLIPANLIEAFPGKIINIHPALLPKYGGKGMYGNRVHQAVIANGEKESGITIHLVDEHYDRGDILYQAVTTVDNNDTADTLAGKIHELEYRYFPEVVERFIRAL